MSAAIGKDIDALTADAAEILRQGELLLDGVPVEAKLLAATSKTARQ